MADVESLASVSRISQKWQGQGMKDFPRNQSLTTGTIVRTGGVTVAYHMHECSWSSDKEAAGLAMFCFLIHL